MVDVAPDYMGYDRTIAVFSPDGRLFQVEYAKEAVKRGVTCIGIIFKGGVVLASIKPKSRLVVTDTTEKIFQIDDGIAAVASGLLADARIVVNQARVRAQIHKITYEEPIDVWTLARVIGDRMQYSTLYAGLRPYGVSFLIAGTDMNGVHLVESDPSGMLYEWRAYAIGRGAQAANKILEQKWKPDMAENEAIQLALDAISKTEKDKAESSLDVVSIKSDRKMKKFGEDELSRIEKGHK
jgi:proteasome alpha subunit